MKVHPSALKHGVAPLGYSDSDWDLDLGLSRGIWAHLWLPVTTSRNKKPATTR